MFLDCGSLLPLCPRQPAAGSEAGACNRSSNNRLLDGKRQQAAAVQNFYEVQITSTTRLPSTLIFGSMPSPGEVLADMKPFSR